MASGRGGWPMAEPGRPPVYVVAICDGGGGVEVLVMDDAAHPAQTGDGLP